MGRSSNALVDSRRRVFSLCVLFESFGTEGDNKGLAADAGSIFNMNFLSPTSIKWSMCAWAPSSRLDDGLSLYQWLFFLHNFGNLSKMPSKPWVYMTFPSNPTRCDEVQKNRILSSTTVRGQWALPRGGAEYFSYERCHWSGKPRLCVCQGRTALMRVSRCGSKKCPKCDQIRSKNIRKMTNNGSKKCPKCDQNQPYTRISPTQESALLRNQPYTRISPTQESALHKNPIYTRIRVAGLKKSGWHRRCHPRAERAP